MDINVRDSKPSDVKELMKTIRPEDAAECLKQGFNPDFGLRYSLKNAVYKKTAVLDGVVSAMWGVCGQWVCETGRPYLVTGTKVLELSPTRFARIYLKETEIMLNLFPRLENYVDSDYSQSVRLLQIAGFTVEPDDAGLRMFWKEA